MPCASRKNTKLLPLNFERKCCRLQTNPAGQRNSCFQSADQLRNKREKDGEVFPWSPPPAIPPSSTPLSYWAFINRVKTCTPEFDLHKRLEGKLSDRLHINPKAFKNKLCWTTSFYLSGLWSDSSKNLFSVAMFWMRSSFFL
jgi:hypothetical protein